MDKNEKTKDEALDKYPGTAINVADGAKATEAEIKQYTELLNDNPRSDGE